MFCLKVFLVLEFIVYVFECFKMSVVFCIDLDDVENIYEVCFYCGIYFEVLEFVEYVICCSKVFRLKVEEVLLKDSYLFFFLVIGVIDCVDDFLVVERESCVLNVDESFFCWS